MAPGGDGWEWPESLDAAVAAREHHSVLLENDRVRVLDTRVDTGDTVPLHTHPWPGVQVLLSLGEFVRRDGEGAVMLDSRAMDIPDERPLVLWSERLPPHTLENVGGEPIHVIVVELKGSPARRPEDS